MFESLIMQAQPAATTSVESLVAVVTAIGALVGVIGAIVTAVASLIKAKSQDPKIDNVADKANTIGHLATAFSQKTAEHEKDAQTFAQVLTALSPEAKKLLEDQQKNLQYFQEKANVATQQLNRLLPLIPKEAQANAIVDLPRENPQTLSVMNTPPVMTAPATVAKPTAKEKDSPG